MKETINRRMTKISAYFLFKFTTWVCPLRWQEKSEMSLSKIMSIDYGTVRIGIALSDPLQIIANPFKVIQNTGEEVFSEIKSIIK